MKTLTDKQVNKTIRKFNKSLYADVFKDRFWVKQYQKARVDGMCYYLYELKDREEPNRDKVINRWVNEFDYERIIFREMNDFIITSNFWEEYWKKNPRQN